MGNIALKFNNGSPLIRHNPSGDAVLVSELGLHTEYELEVLRNQLDAEREAHEKALAESEARYVAQTDALLKVEREAHARTLAALRAVVGHFVGVDHHRDDCPGLLDHDGLTVLGPVCRDHQVAEQAEAAIAAAKVTP